MMVNRSMRRSVTAMSSIGMKNGLICNAESVVNGSLKMFCITTVQVAVRLGQPMNIGVIAIGARVKNVGKNYVGDLRVERVKHREKMTNDAFFRVSLTQ